MCWQFQRPLSIRYLKLHDTTGLDVVLVISKVWSFQATFSIFGNKRWGLSENWLLIRHEFFSNVKDHISKNYKKFWRFQKMKIDLSFLFAVWNKKWNFINWKYFSHGKKNKILTIYYSSSSFSEEIVPRLPRREDVKSDFGCERVPPP